MKVFTIGAQNHDEYHAEIAHFVNVASGAQDVLTFDRVKHPDDFAALAGPRLHARSACQHALRYRDELGPAQTGQLIVVVDGNVSDRQDDEYFMVDSTDEGLPRGATIVSMFFIADHSAFTREVSAGWQQMSRRTRRRLASDALQLLILYTAATARGFLPHQEFRGCVMDYCQRTSEILGALRGGFTFCRECTAALQTSADGEALLAIAHGLNAQPFRVNRRPPHGYDVFMCYHQPDRPLVEDLCDALRSFGLAPWLDVKELPPGRSWKDVILDRIGEVQSASVCVGPAGLGPWQMHELEAFTREFATRRIPVIPVLLPNTVTVPDLPQFLEERTWVDFRRADPDPLQHLKWGITGERPRS